MMTAVPIASALPVVRRAGGRTIRRFTLRLLVAVLAVGAWQLAALVLGPTVVAPPLATAAEIGILVTTEGFWAAVGSTVLAALLGLVISAGVGIPLGLAVGGSRFALDSSRLVVDVLRTVPPVALIPVVLLMFGPTITMQVSLIVFGAIWPLFIQSTYGVREVDGVLRDVGTAYGLGRTRAFFFISLPSSLPFVFAGFRIAATVALLIAVASELIASAPGIGREIGLAQLNGATTTAYAYVVVAALLGVAVGVGVGAVQRVALFWHPSVRGDAA